MAKARKKRTPQYTTKKPKAKPKPRKALDDFVKGGAGEAKPKGLVPRVKGPAMRRLTIYVTPELHKRVKVHAAGLDQNLSEWLAALIERELSS